MRYIPTSERGSPQYTMHIYCAAIYQASKGRFLRLCAWLDAGSAVDFAWSRLERARATLPSACRLLAGLCASPPRDRRRVVGVIRPQIIVMKNMHCPKSQHVQSL